MLDSQTWTNNSSGILNIRTFRASDLAAGPVTLTLNAASSGNIVFNLAASDSPDTTKTLGIVVDSVGTGTVSMVASPYSGGTTVKRGILSTSGTVGTGPVLLGDTSGTSAARLHNSSGSTIANTITVQAGNTGSLALTGVNGSVYSGSLILNNNLTIGSSSGGVAMTYGGNISGTGNLTLARIGGATNSTLTLSGSNSYTGKTIIESSIAVVSSINSVTGGSATSSLGAPTTVANGTISLGAVAASTLRYVGAGETTDRVIDLAGTTPGVTLDQSGSGLLKFTSNFTATGSGNKTLTLTGTTSGSGEISGIIGDSAGGATGLTKSGGNTWRLSGLNTYTGNTSISGGVLEVTTMTNGGVASSMGMDTNAAGNLTISNGATLRYVGSGSSSTNRLFTVGSGGAVIDASGAGTISFTNTTTPSWGTANVANTITFTGSNVGANTFAGAINNNGSGPISVVKEGVGTWILTGNTTYAGGTTINAGTLLVNGSLAAGSAVALNSAVLGGSGTAAGLVTTSGTSSTISPGNSPGTLTLSGGLDASAGATFVFELGTTSDVLSLGSGVLTGSSAAGELVFNFSNAGGLLTGNPYTIITFGSSSGLDYADLTAAVVPVGYALDTSFGTGGFLINGNNLQVQFAVPEPSTMLLLTGGLTVVLALRRRRKN